MTATPEPAEKAVAQEPRKAKKEKVTKPASDAAASSSNPEAEAQLAAAMAEIRQLRSELSNVSKGKKLQEEKAKQATQFAKELELSNKELTEQIGEYEQESGLKTSTSEREQSKQIKKLSNQLQ